MAKKSAYSKGYRHYKKEAKGFTEKEKKIMIIGFSLLILIVVCVIAIPNIIEARHLLKVRNDAIVGIEDTWLVANMSDTSKAKYRKIAEIVPAEGYELSSVEEGISDKPAQYYYYAPTTEDAVVDEYYAIVGKGEYNELGATSLDYMTGFAEEIFYASEIETTEVNGIPATYYVLEYTMNVSEDPETPELQYNQNVSLYLDSNVDGRCVLVSATNTGADESAFHDRDAVIETMKAAAACVTLE